MERFINLTIVKFNVKMILNKKAHGGPLDIIHTFIVIGIAIIIIRFSYSGTPITPQVLIILSIVIIVFELLGMMM